MAYKVLKLQILRGAIARRVLLRAFLFVLAMAIFPSLQLFRDVEPMELFALGSYDCALDVGSNSYLLPNRYLKPASAYAFPLFAASLKMPCKENANFTIDMFRELMDEKLLNSGAKALCVGEGSALAISALQELGLSDASRVNRHSFFSLLRKNFVFQLEFNDNSYDFVFSRALDKISVPALVVLEIERVLRPGGIGAILVVVPSSNTGSLLKSATPISSFLKSSDVVHVRSINSFTLVVFRKRFDNVNSVENYRLPYECPSVTNNKPLIKYLEPLVEEKPVEIEGRFSYLPKFMDISSRKRLIYIDIGAGEVMNSSISNWFLPFYPVQSRAFDVYVVDHDTTVLSSYVNRPGVTFVYHPGLAGNKDTANPDSNLDSSLYDEGFDFLVWFKQTVTVGDFVVLKMNACRVELKLLHELFESGAICLVDELFLRCQDSMNVRDATSGDCMDLFRGLRNSGVFVHQW